jgi:hypothetical protein
MRTRCLAVAALCIAAAAGCSRSNNLLLGRVEAVVAGHSVVVTDCYRAVVPQPVKSPDGATFTPCRDAVVTIRASKLNVNGKSYGSLADGAAVLVDHGRVSVASPSH